MTDDRQTIADALERAEKATDANIVLRIPGRLNELVGIARTDIPELARGWLTALDEVDQALKDATQNAADTRRAWDRAKRLAAVARLADEYMTDPPLGEHELREALGALHDGDMDQ